MPRGNCGVDADVMVARNFVYRHVTIGTSYNIFHTQYAARTLKASAESPKSGLKIRDKEKLLKYAEMAGLNSHEDVNKVAVNFANWVLEDMGRPYWEESSMTKAFAPPKRQELWRNSESRHLTGQ
ncbi:MAG: carbon-monoxide dehydrogenase, catalytic subunit [Firmicutes bacterium]|nr:carbon-monoxide dehydrogenase, catalytic subunit [Bacillota bacterium]